MNSNDVYITQAQACLGPVCLLTGDSDHTDEDKKCSQPLHFVLWPDLMISGTQGGHDGLKYWHRPVLARPKKCRGLSEQLSLIAWALPQLGGECGGIIELLGFTVWKCCWGCDLLSRRITAPSHASSPPHPANADHNPDHKPERVRQTKLGRRDNNQTCGLCCTCWCRRRKVSNEYWPTPSRAWHKCLPIISYLFIFIFIIWARSPPLAPS